MIIIVFIEHNISHQINKQQTWHSLHTMHLNITHSIKYQHILQGRPVLRCDHNRGHIADWQTQRLESQMVDYWGEQLGVHVLYDAAVTVHLKNGNKHTIRDKLEQKSPLVANTPPHSLNYVEMCCQVLETAWPSWWLLSHRLSWCELESMSCERCCYSVNKQ